MPTETRAADPDRIWNHVRADLRASLPAATFKLWLEPIDAVSARGTTLYLSAPREVRTWVERRYRGLVTEALRRRAPELTEVDFVDEAGAGADTRSPRTAGSGAAIPRSLPVDRRHTFDAFVIGAGNRLAHSSALAVAELPGEAYNPLFLHGPPGLGKTHLLGAIADYVRRNHPGLTVHYTTAERFTSEFVTALRSAGPEAFKERYRGLDALLIDDIQLLEGKHRTEEEFVHTFNALYASGKQIVLSSDRAPDALSRLAERLRDRFGWGLTVGLDPPDVPTRVILLWRLAAAATRPVPEPDVLREIALRTPGNVRRLEAAMTRVLALASLESEPIRPQLVRRALGDETRKRVRDSTAADDPIGLEAIQDAVCAVHGLTRAELISPRRSNRVAHARQLAMFLARELTSLSLAEIARHFDRDHTTVLHALRAVGGRLEPESETVHAIHRVKAALGIDTGDTQASRPGDPR